MLNPATLTDAIVTAFQSIPELVTAMGGDPTAIYAHHFLNGVESTLTSSIYEMKSPSILVVYQGTLGGNFDGYTVFKHQVTVFVRSANVAQQSSPVGYETLVWMMLNKPVLGGSSNIRQANVIPEVDIMDNPSVSHMTDESGNDFFKVDTTWPEIGDN
jgi:hypothetical protein